MATTLRSSAYSQCVRSATFAATALTLECIPPTIEPSLPSPENAEQVSFALVTRCGPARLAPGLTKVQAFVLPSFQANTGLLLTTHPELVLQVTTKTNTQRKPPVSPALLATNAPRLLSNLLRALPAQSHPSYAKHLVTPALQDFTAMMQLRCPKIALMVTIRMRDGCNAPCVRLAIHAKTSRVQLLAPVVGIVFWAGCSVDLAKPASTAQSSRKLLKTVQP